MFSFVLGIFSILAMTGNTVKIEQASETWSQALAQKFGQEEHKYKGYPDSATYIECHSGWFESRIGANGFILVWIGANIPGDETDTNYQDTVDLKVVKELGINSVNFYLPMPPDMIPDTNNPVTSVGLNDGEGMVWLRDSQSENLILWAIPKDSTLKPSHPIPYTIETSGDSATRLKIEGPKRINIAGGNNDMGGRYLVRVVDDSGYIVTSYGDIIDPDSVSIKVIEEFPDSSAKLKDFMTGEGDSVGCGLISGQANVFLSDSMVEKVTLIATSNTGSLIPDTFEVDVRPSDEATVIFPISFSGTYGTRGVDKSILAIAFLEDGPDPNNNTSQVELAPIDIMGTASAVISPVGPQTLTGGLASFTLSDDEADSGVIVHTILSGTPELSPWWFEKVGYGFKEPGDATLIHPFGPSTAIVGDTAVLYVHAVDANDSLDITYDGWVWIGINDENSSCVSLEYGTGDTLDIIHIQNGIGRAWVTDPEVEEVNIEFEDAEKGDGPFGGYLGNFGLPDDGMKISFELPGDSASHWVLELPKGVGNKFPTGLKVVGTIKACDDSGLVDTAFNDTAQFTISGFAVPADTNIPMTKGIETIEFSDDSVEKVVVVVSGAGLTPWVDTVEFVTPNTATWLVPIAPEEILVNDSLTCVIYAMTPEFGIDTSWNGVAKVSYWDPGASSVSWVGNPDSIPITNGSGRIVMLDSEVESVAVFLEYVSGNPPLSPMDDDTGYIQFEAKLVGILPDSTCAVPTTIIFKTVDVLDSLTEYTTWIHFWCVEEIPNGSVVFNPSDSFQIVDGLGHVEIQDFSEPESVWIYISTEDPLIQERDEFLGSIALYFPGVEEEKIPSKFSFSLGSPNPFANRAIIRYSLPAGQGIYDSRLTIYDLTGRTVRTLVNRKEKPGYYTVKWDGRDSNHRKLASGIYFCKLESGDYQVTKKLILLR